MLQELCSNDFKTYKVQNQRKVHTTDGLFVILSLSKCCCMAQGTHINLVKQRFGLTHYVICHILTCITLARRIRTEGYLSHNSAKSPNTLSKDKAQKKPQQMTITCESLKISHNTNQEWFIPLHSTTSHFLFEKLNQNHHFTFIHTL